MSLTNIVNSLPKRYFFQGLESRIGGIKQQKTFLGLFNSYVWDNECGFGYTRDNELVLVSQDASGSSSSSESTEMDAWYRILAPVMEIDHSLLRDELQMNVLTYDNDVIQPQILKDVIHNVAIYKANVDSIAEGETVTSAPKCEGFDGQSRNKED